MIKMMEEAMEFCGAPEEMVGLLADCQQAAVHIANVIEEKVDPQHDCIKCLEEYAELIYRAGNIIHDDQQYFLLIEAAHKQLLLVKEQIRYRIEKTFEIVFLPYKASMWDCFDSIYRTIAQEGKHNAVVMPIPYFNMDSHQKSIDMVYEGQDFPEDIQITDYRKYNLNENQPDAIFIHNPYDEYNWVTRVPGQFFSTELIKATKHLVYIPYMIRSGDTMPDHLVLMPGVANAWRVYVQSEAIRENYLKYYPFTNEIIAVGSPKIDMVLRMEEQEKVLPEQWREKLQGKKVFLYNTHLHNIINNADKLFAEYDYVLREFIGRDEVALLWRPHPLSVETIKTFKPYILDDYVKYLNQAEKQGNIVIDRSADLHRAIALSDAYVGDQSSLVELYGVTGKPIFIIDSEKFTNKKWSFRGFVEVDNELWIPEMIDKSLFKINKMTWKAEYVNQFFTKDFKDTIQAIPREIKNVHHKILSAFRQNILIY
jgi:CDP-glycerol glycerophosphotransferase (TagB/SpsB family)